VKGHIAKKCVRRCAQLNRKCSSRCARYYYVLDASPETVGKRKQVWSKGHRTRREAEVSLAEELQRRNEGIVVSGGRVTVAEFMNHWLNHMATLGRDDRTLERYRELLELHVLPAIGGVQLKALQPHQLS
jgi:hypothetical protein